MIMPNIAIEGLPGTGKDTLAEYIRIKYGYTVLSFCEPLKRIVQQIYGFSDQQLFGPSKYRDEPDLRYKRADGSYLTPRIALKLFGTEAGRECYESTWYDMGMRKAADANKSGHPWVFTDTRFELQKLRDTGLCLCVRLKRLGAIASDHASDAHANLPDSFFDLVLSTDGSIEETQGRFDAWLSEVCNERKRLDQKGYGAEDRPAYPRSRTG